MTNTSWLTSGLQYILKAVLWLTYQDGFVIKYRANIISYQNVWDQWHGVTDLLWPFLTRLTCYDCCITLVSEWFMFCLFITVRGKTDIRSDGILPKDTDDSWIWTQICSTTIMLSLKTDLFLLTKNNIYHLLTDYEDEHNMDNTYVNGSSINDITPQKTEICKEPLSWLHIWK